eukprot:COSAG06_NODE_6050_length_3134_cov_27.352883_2_plen_323_part_00
MAVLDQVRLPRGLHQASVERHVPLRAAAVQLHAVEVQGVQLPHVALVVDLERVTLAASAAVLVPAHFKPRGVAVLDEPGHVRELGVDHGVPVRGVLRSVHALAAALPTFVDARGGVAGLEERGVLLPVNCPQLGDQRVDGRLHVLLGHAVAPRVPRAPAPASLQRRGAVSQRLCSAATGSGAAFAFRLGAWDSHRRRERDLVPARWELPRRVLGIDGGSCEQQAACEHARAHRWSQPGHLAANRGTLMAAKIVDVDRRSPASKDSLLTYNRSARIGVDPENAQAQNSQFLRRKYNCSHCGRVGQAGCSVYLPWALLRVGRSV